MRKGRYPNLPIELRSEGTTHSVWDHLELHVGVMVSKCCIDRRGTKELLHQVVGHDLAMIIIQ